MTNRTRAQRLQKHLLILKSAVCKGLKYTTQEWMKVIYQDIEVLELEVELTEARWKQSDLMEVITIPGGFPNLNRIIATRKNPLSAYAKFKQIYTNLVTVAVKNRYTPITNYPVSVHFEWYCKDRRTDPANIATTKEMVIDGLVAGGILVGGGWVHIHGLSDKFFVDDENPRVVVSIREREES